MKEMFIGIGEACLYMTILVLTFWVLKGFETPTELEIADILAVGAIIRHFVDKEKLRNKAMETHKQKPTKVEPKFKHGDRVRNKKSGLEQTLGSCIEDVYEGAFPFRIKDQDDWELVEQNPAWSEEDKNIIQWIICDVEDLYRLNKKVSVIADKEINWLKHLEERYTWKPSDEQMEALKDALNDAICQYDFKGSLIKEEVTRKHVETIESLYNDLKKLKK